MTRQDSQPLLEVKDLKTWFRTDQGIARAVDGVSYAIYPGETLAVVGESGCGKSVTALSILRLLPEPPAEIAGGQILFDGRNLLDLDLHAMRGIRGNDITMIFQEPMTSMNPVFRAGDQIAATIRLHQKVDLAEARRRTLTLLEQVGIPAPEKRIDDYPHQLSGGMLQRIMIALALACGPRLLIADEPTTALDVTIQAQILDLLRKLQQDRGMAILLITHDLGVVAEMASRVVVMYAGHVQEEATVHELFKNPQHPYTRGLFASLPSMQSNSKRLHTIQGTVPPATAFPEGCRFAPRCPHAMPVCREKQPPIFPIAPGHGAACWLHDAETSRAEGRPTGIPADGAAP
ncbi:MAG: ABC transporter ATP-binding protein [Candidatus Hydrogenedentes bacterium]|nr:ABC transporter ATP-binding protein [Candidatus Hydrogenedentota bacterium]